MFLESYRRAYMCCKIGCMHVSCPNELEGMNTCFFSFGRGGEGGGLGLYKLV